VTRDRHGATELLAAAGRGSRRVRVRAPGHRGESGPASDSDSGSESESAGDGPSIAASPVKFSTWLSVKLESESLAAAAATAAQAVLERSLAAIMMVTPVCLK
jgi:hypothetical protein